jgi:hypothetical protein
MGEAVVTVDETKRITKQKCIAKLKLRRINDGAELRINLDASFARALVQLSSNQITDVGFSTERGLFAYDVPSINALLSSARAFVAKEKNEPPPSGAPVVLDDGTYVIAFNGMYSKQRLRSWIDKVNAGLQVLWETYCCPLSLNVELVAQSYAEV